jgi:hypothetical protein
LAPGRPTVARQRKIGGAIAERAARQSTAARALRCTKRDGKTAKRRGDHGGAHLGQQMTRQTVIAARGGRAAPPDSGDDGDTTWGSSDYKKTMGSFVKTSSSSSWLQLR